MSIRIVVDLPEPFGPRKPNTFPRGISNETRSTAVNVPNLRVRFSQRRREEFQTGQAGRLAPARRPCRARTNASSSVGATRRTLSAGTSPRSASSTLPSRKSSVFPPFFSLPRTCSRVPKREMSSTSGSAARRARASPRASRRDLDERARVGREDLVARADARGAGPRRGTRAASRTRPRPCTASRRRS